MESDLLKQQLTQAVLDPAVRPDPFEPLDHILDVAEEENLLPMLAKETEPPAKSSTVDPARFYVHGFSLFRLGEPDLAWPSVLRLAGKLEQESHWPALALLCGRALDYQPNVDAALQVAKAFESAGFEDLDPAFLHKAYGLFPDECRLAGLMGDDRSRSAAKAGGTETTEGRTLLGEAYEYWAESLDGFVALKRHASIEATLLKVAESDNPLVLRHVVAALKKLGEQAVPKKPTDQSGWGRVEAIMELALPALRRAKLLPDLWRNLLSLLPQMPSGNSIRRWLSDLAPEAFPEADGIHDLMNRSGLLDPEANVETAVKALEPMLALAPGYFIMHASWGIGRIRLNDGETLILDFQEASNHRMSVALAKRALTVVPADDLRVVKVQDPAGLKSKAKDDPEGVVFLAIRQLGGSATTQDLKRVLVTEEVLTASQWTAWWKAAKTLIEQDDRFDLSQAFRQTYRIRTASDGDELALPVIVPRRGVRPNLNLIRRFLDQHPDETGRAARIYTSILQRWARQDKTNAEERMAIGLQLHRWQRRVDEDFIEALAGVLDGNYEASTFADLVDQTLLVTVGLGHVKLWRQTACFALSSRYHEVRELALERLRREPEPARGLLAELIEQPNDRPVAALAVIALSTVRESLREPFVPPVWDAAYGAAVLIETTVREPIRKQALAVLGPKSTFTELLLKTLPGETQIDRLSNLIRRWRTSERFLQPLENIMRAAGFEHLLRDLRTERMAGTNQMLLSHAEQDTLILPPELMTRATFEKLRREIQRLDKELHTTLAQTIARARALGDLSENAEFSAAKAKQRDYTARLASMGLRLERATVIEEYHPPDGRAAPGTEVRLEEPSSGAARTYWILGEGDDYHGPEVLSYAAPLGRALLGRRVGDKVQVTSEGEMLEFFLRSIRPRLPETQPAEAGLAEAGETGLPGTDAPPSL
jgi:transcription elongation factor GreA